MPLYSYTALTEAGVRVTGEGVATSVQELTQELTGKGLLIQRIQKRRARFKLFHRERIKPEEFLLFNQEFMALVRAGLTIPEALQLAAHRPDNPGLGRILQRVLEDVRGGVILSEACARHREVFDALYVSALKTGEKTGDLPNVHVPADGRLAFEVLLPGATLSSGSGALLDADGAALMLHAGADDYRTNPAGAAGDRIACGVITR